MNEANQLALVCLLFGLFTGLAIGMNIGRKLPRPNRRIFTARPPEIHSAGGGSRDLPHVWASLVSPEGWSAVGCAYCGRRRTAALALGETSCWLRSGREEPPESAQFLTPLSVGPVAKA